MQKIQETNKMEMPTIKIWNEQRVVTFKDIDTVHNRPTGTAKKRFHDNRTRFIEGEDFFRISASEFRTAFGNMDKRQQNDVTILTETGYLMIVKSFTDDLAWNVQRQLVNTYFKAKEMIAEQSSPELPMQSNTPVPLRKSGLWYYDNKEIVDYVCKELSMSYSELYHHILYFLGKKYDLNAAKKLYKKERGCSPDKPMDIVDYFRELGEMATEILESYYRIATT